MYNTELAKDITFELILSKTTEYDIFKYYIGSDFKLNSIMSSPLREDKNPSFGVFKSYKSGELLFKDQATGDCGNCVVLVMKLYNITYYAALKQIFNDLTLGKVFTTSIGKSIDKYKPSTNSILIQKKNFSKYDDLYWNQYGIDRDDLKRFKVHPISCFWVNDIKQSIYYENNSPLYAYEIFNKFKVYKPLASKDIKWRANAGTYDIQGYEQLPDKCEHIIITKSLKDVIVLTKLGYNAIAPNGENHTIPEVIINKLRKDKVTTKFTVFYDNDEAGRTANKKLLNKYQEFNLIEIEPEFMNEYWGISNPLLKDISDYVKKYGLKKAKEWLKSNIT